jgi:hypothetical protein
MRRREFCAAGVAALTAVSFPYRRAAADSPATEISAIGLDGRPVTLRPSDIEDLRAALRGDLITADQASYDEARRLWNAAFDRRPALIVRCAGAADVMRAVSFTAAHGLLTAVRGGGHSLSGQSGCDGGLVVDVSLMRAVEVDPIAKQARVEAGVLLGQFDREAQAFGLATTAGTVADTGVAGLTLGGGVGRIGRRFGLSADNVMSADLVTADGRWMRASASENPDLLWGLRGGGGNFGVVTAFTYRLHEVTPMMYGGTVTFPMQGGRQLLQHFAQFIATAPDELYVDVDLGTDGKLGRTVEFDVCYSGPAADAERVVAPLRKLGKPLQDKLGPALYVTLQGSANASEVNHYGSYVKGALIQGLSAPLIDAIVGSIESTTLDSAYIWLQHQGGAISRVAPADTAYWNRTATHNLGVGGSWKVPGDGAGPNTEWARKAWAQIEPLTHGNYVNLANTDDRDSRVHAAYGDNYTRLAALKKTYDPTNLFRLNANIKPAA